MVPLFSISVCVVSIAFLLIGIFILLKNKTSPVNRTLFRLASATFLWLYANSMMYVANDYNKALQFMRVGYVATIFLPVLFYHFITEFLGMKQAIRKILIIFYGISTFFTIALYTTNYVSSGLLVYSWGFYAKAGPLHPVFLVYFIAVFEFCIFSIFSCYKKNKTAMSIRQQLQLKYLFAAFFITVFAIGDFLPSYGIDYRPFGYISIFLWMAITTYAIVKHQLLDIEVVIRRAVVFAGLFAAVYGVFAFFAFLTQDILRNITGGNRWVALVPSVVIVTLALRPLQDFLVAITDKFLFQKKYDYKQLLRKLSREVMTIMDLSKLCRRIVEDLVTVARLESSAIVLFDREKENYKIVASKGVRDKNVVLRKDGPTPTFLQATHTHIMKGPHTERMNDKDTIKEDLKRLNAEFIVPLIIRDNLIGLISLGMKKSGEEYNQDDISLLETLAGTASVAISNAQYVVNTMKLEAEAAQREKMAVIGTLAAGINHEICNPLGIARGQCEVFLLNKKDGFFKDRSKDEQIAEAMKIMNKVIHEADRATSITKKLSSFAKPSKGEISNNVSLRDEINEVMALVGHELKLEKIGVNINIPAGVPFITCDRKQLQQVLFNIIRNAGQAIEGEGVITINVGREDEKVKIDIKDTGPGIPKEKLSEIFNPFYTTKEPGKGTGLGLFIVRQLVERNKGKLSVDSEPGKGAVFMLEFPVSEKVKI